MKTKEEFIESVVNIVLESSFDGCNTGVAERMAEKLYEELSINPKPGK